MERQLDYRHVFPARSLYRLRYITMAVLAIAGVHLLNCLFVDPAFYGFSLLAVLAASIEVHVRLREDASSDEASLAFGMLFISGVFILIALAAAGALIDWLLSLLGLTLGVSHFLEFVVVVIGVGVIFWRYCREVGAKSGDGAGTYQTILLSSIVVTLLIIGSWLFEVVGDSGRLVVIYTLVFALAVAIVEVTFRVGERAVLGPD
jgi:hypothetical protein